ncbi:unnamed protein product [Aphanomyces euteiches]
MNQIEVGAFVYVDWNNGGEKTLNVSLVQDYAAHGYRDLLTQLQSMHMNTTNGTKGIPIIYGFDSIHGANYIGNATLFPQPINTGATFDVAHAREVGKFTGRDTLAAGFPWVYSPMLEVVRHKHWPRVFESFNEDPVAVSAFGAAYISAMQEPGVAACFKHFIGYSDPTDGKDRTDVVMDSYEIMNYFVPPFKAAIDEAKVMSGMGTYIGWNGIPISANSLIHHGLLRHDLGFNGTMVTDWGEIYLLNELRQVVATDLDAIDVSMNRSTYDMVMTPHDMSFIDHGKVLLSQGRLDRERLATSVERLLTLKYQLDLFRNPIPGAELVPLVGDALSQEKSLAAARDSLVLLKNKGVLPLAANTSVFLTGSSADNIGLQCGGWSKAWQGIDGNALYPRGWSIRKALETDYNATGHNSSVAFLEGIAILGNLTNETTTQAVLMAANASVTVVAIGERTYAEIFGNSDPMALDDGFLQYMKALRTASKALVLVLIEGRPRTLNGIAELADAVIWAGLPCEFGGRAIVDVLYGKVNPNGKLPLTYPKTDRFVNIATPYYFRRGDQCIKGKVVSECPTEWQYGSGLSYTTFTYTDMTLSSTSVGPSNSAVSVSVKLTNSGSVAGKEVVMLFLTPPVTHTLTETRLLKKFTKISLAAGESTIVSFDLSRDDWGYYPGTIGQGLNKIAPSGSYQVFFKASTECSQSSDTSTALCRSFKWDNGTKSSGNGASAGSSSDLSASVAVFGLFWTLICW